MGGTELVLGLISGAGLDHGGDTTNRTVVLESGDLQAAGGCADANCLRGANHSWGGCFGMGRT